MQGAGLLFFDQKHDGTSQCLEVQVPYNGDAAREPLTTHFPSVHPDLLAYATCTVPQKMAQNQHEEFASISGAQTTHTYSHQQLEFRELQHNGHGAVYKD